MIRIMKKTIFILMVVFATSSNYGQETQKTETKTFDPKLIGCWKGSEID